MAKHLLSAGVDASLCFVATWFAFGFAFGFADISPLSVDNFADRRKFTIFVGKFTHSPFPTLWR